VKSVLYSSPYVPPEWIAAHGLRPSRVRPDHRLGSPAAGVCPFADGFLRKADAALAEGWAAAAVVTTTCDQMRRGAELIGDGLFLLNVPHTWGTTTAHRTFRTELVRLGRFLEARGGRAPGDAELVETLRRFDDARRTLRSDGGRLGGRAFAEALAAFDERGDGSADVASVSRAPSTGVRVALIGGPLRAEDLAIHDILEAAGAHVVLDATETGERGLPAPFDRRRLSDDPLLELTDAYFGAIPDAFRRPNDALYRWLRAEIDARGVGALVVVHCVWCDLWHAEVERLREWAGLPLVAITLVDGDGGARRGVETRLQALVEAAS
jgi:2-hydroxyglutaryl-CoA dehydratase, D-component